MRIKSSFRKIAIDRMAVFSYNSLYDVKALKHKRFKVGN